MITSNKRTHSNMKTNSIDENVCEENIETPPKKKQKIFLNILLIKKFL